MHIAVTGASGYIGGRLVPLLADRGHQLTLLTRDPGRLSGRFPGTRVADADLLEPASLPPALAGSDVAYYLAHSMAEGESGFADRDWAAARNFASAAAAAGVGRIVYLGGLGDDSHGLSRHLASRHRVGEELARHGVPVTEFRAAIVIGAGSASFEILRHLTERLPVMITPRWVSTRCQPIGIRDVLDYLIATLDHPEVTGIVEIGCPDVLTYGEMMMEYARLRGLRRTMIPVPVLTPRLSSYWVSLVTPAPSGIARPLIEGLRNEVVIRDPGPAQAFGLQPEAYRDALQAAIDRTDRHEIESTWFDSYATVGALPAVRSHLESREGMIIERRARHVRASPEVVFGTIEQVGGEAGWPYANALWRVRAGLDRVVGGVGMRLGRRDPDNLRPGDALDFWRVEEIRRPELLRLRAEMKLPGKGWLQFEVRRAKGGSRVVQTAFFEPRGLLGLTYWYGLYPAHAVIFLGMIRRIAEHAEAAAR
jgi:uncharacterized protein YbjT (DUF2867 family)